MSDLLPVEHLTRSGEAVVIRTCHAADASALLDYFEEFAETVAEIEAARCVRLDAYSENPAALRLYERRGYRRVGTLRFPQRTAPFVCFERATRWAAPEQCVTE